MTLTSNETFVETAVAAVPELRDIYEAHLADNGTLLPHVFMGDLTRYTLQIARSVDCIHVVRRVLVLIEEGLRSSDDDVVNLVAVSFVENLCGEGDALAALIPLMGEATRRELAAMCGIDLAVQSSHVRK